MATTSKAILAKIGCAHLRLEKVVGHAYWLFTYDNGDQYETHSIYVARLNQMNESQWVAEGKALVEQMEGEF